MNYFYEIHSDLTKYTISIINSIIGDSIVIQNHSTSNGWLLEQILPANGVYVVSFVNTDKFCIHTNENGEITSTLECSKDGSVKYFPKDYFKQPVLEPEKKPDTTATDKPTDYYESRLMIDNVIRKLATGHSKEDIIANDDVTMGFLIGIQNILIDVLNGKNYAHVDKLALLKDVVKNYVANKCNEKLKFLYFVEGHTTGKLLEITKIPIEEFRAQIAMLILHRELIDNFAG